MPLWNNISKYKCKSYVFRYENQCQNYFLKASLITKIFNSTNFHHERLERTTKFTNKKTFTSKTIFDFLIFH